MRLPVAIVICICFLGCCSESKNVPVVISDSGEPTVPKKLYDDLKKKFGHAHMKIDELNKRINELEKKERPHVLEEVW